MILIAESYLPKTQVPPTWPKKPWLTGTAALLLALIVVATYVTFQGGESLPTADKKLIVVLPFENLGLPEDAYFAAGMTEEIISRLAAVSGLGVISQL